MNTKKLYLIAVQKIILCLTQTCSPIASGFLLITIINIPYYYQYH